MQAAGESLAVAQHPLQEILQRLTLGPIALLFVNEEVSV